MEFNENYNPYQHYAKLQSFIANHVGEPTEPTTEEVFHKWDQMANNLSPRTFMFMVDVKKSDVLRAAGMSLLGHPDNYRFNRASFIEWTHDNQKRLVAYLTLSMYEVFFEHPQLIINTDFVYSTTRGVKDKEGKYWHMHQLASPCQFDENGLMVRYISNYRILGEYTGQPLETQVYGDKKHDAKLKVLSKKVDAIKEGMLKVLGLTKQEELILYLRVLSNMSTREVADHLGLSIRTLRNHYGNINKKAKEVFPLNSFSGIEDVIAYIKQQKLI